MKPQSLGILLALAYTPLSFAFFCPSNFSQVEIGDSLAQVKQTCGKADKETSFEKDPTVPQEWNYYIPQPVSFNSTQQSEGTAKMSVAFDKDGRLINISANGIGVGATSACGTSIQLGDTQESVESACGKPSFVNKQQADGTTLKKTKITELLYNSNPPVTLVFEDGILTGSK